MKRFASYGFIPIEQPTQFKAQRECYKKNDVFFYNEQSRISEFEIFVNFVCVDLTMSS